MERDPRSGGGPVSAVVPPGAAGLHRRALLRAGLVGGAAVVAGASLDGTTRAVARRWPVAGGAAVVTGLLPAAADWERLVGHEVVLTGAGIGRVLAQVVDVRDVAVPSPGVRLEGDAYSLLLDAPSLPRSSVLQVTVDHEAVGAPALSIVPVNGDGSWEAVVDRRVPIPTR